MTTINSITTNTFLLRLHNGYGSYSSSGFIVKYFNIGDTISIININNNCLFYQNGIICGGLKINLL